MKLNYLLIMPEIILFLFFVTYFIYNIYYKYHISLIFNSLGKDLITYIENFYEKNNNIKGESVRNILLKVEDKVLIFTTNIDYKYFFFMGFFCFVASIIYFSELYFIFLNPEAVGYGQRVYLFDNMIVVDSLSIFLKMLLTILCSLYFFLMYYMSKVWKFYGFEYGFFIFLIMYSMLILVSVYDFFLFFIVLELQSLSIVVIGSYQMTQKRSIEAGLKYFIYGSYFSGILLFSISLLYILFGSLSFEVIYQLTKGGTLGSILKDNMFLLSLSLIFFLIFFKLGVVPYHFWVADVYQGSSLLVTTFLAVISKIGILGLVIRLQLDVLVNFYYFTSEIIYYVGVSSMLLGSLMAIYQTDLRRFLAFSSVSNLGYVLAGFSLGTLDGYYFGLYYFITYVISTFVLFLFILGLVSMDKYDLSLKYKWYLEDNSYDFKFCNNIYDFQNMYRNNKILSLFLILILLNLIGVPPFLFFFSKFFLVISALEVQMYLFIFIFILVSFLSTFYYLRIIRIIFLNRENRSRLFVFNSKILFYLFIILILLQLVLMLTPMSLSYIISFIELVLDCFVI